MPLAAFAGATIVAVFVYLFAWKNDGLSPIILVLIGVGFWALTKAATTLFMLLAPIYQASQAECMDYGYRLWLFLAKCYGTCTVGSHFNGNIIYSC